MKFRLCFFMPLFLFASLAMAQEQTSTAITSKDSTNISEMETFLDSTLVKVKRLYYDGDYAKVIALGTESVAKSRKEGVFPQQFAIRSFLGNTYLRMDDTVAARNMFEENLKKAKASENDEYIMGATIDLGNVYRLEDNNEKAIQSFLDAGKIAENNKDARRIFIVNYNIAEIYVEDNIKPKEATTHLNKAEVALKELDRYFFHAALEALWGFYYLKLKVPDKAISNFEESIAHAKQANHVDGLSSAYQGLVEAQELAGNYQEALQTYKTLDSLKQKQFVLDKKEYRESVEAKQENTKIQQALASKELENELIKEKALTNKVILYFTICLALVLGTLLLLLGRSTKKRKKLIFDLKTKNRKYIKEKKRSEKLAQAKNKFFSTVTHDLRTPLYGIIGLTNTLMDEPDLKGHRHDIKSLKFSADYLLALINDVLQINKLETKKTAKLDKQQFSVRELVADLVESLQYMKKQNNNTVQISIDEQIPNYIIGDRLKLSQILMNLVANALKFTHNGRVEICVSEEKSTKKNLLLCFEVRDNGKGIPLEKQKLIFEEFGQLERERSFEGTGLGLTIVSKLLRVMDSNIHLESDGVNGSRFYFTVQFKKSEQIKSTELDLLISEKTARLIGKKVLIVDDNKVNQLVTKKIVAKYDMDFDVAENGSEAVAMAKKGEYHLVLMDINMPVMDGVEATRQIRSFNKEVKIIGLTAVELVELGDRLKEVRFEDIIIKPYALNTFLSTLIKNIS